MPAAQRFQGAFETKEVATKLKLLGVPAENWKGLVSSWLGNPPYMKVLMRKYENI
jgi:hypothetical protein